VVETKTSRGEPGIAVVTGWEWILASGELEFDVLERVERRELLQ
jgi:hypothetical protein